MVEEREEKELRVPMEGEVIGMVVQLLGYDRVKVKCADGKVRVCRIPGRMKKKVWLREGDYVVVAPWDFQSDQRGDVVWRYSRDEIKKLEARGLIPSL